MAFPTLSWISQLLPASFRGIPFVVETSGFTTGRRVALHEYPYKDLPYAEDMGLANQVLNFTGFFVGDDCYLKRDLMAAACQKSGPGILMHPSLYFCPSVTLLTATFNERADKGRVVEVQFSFVVTDDIPVLSLFSLVPFNATTELIGTAVSTFFGASKSAFATIMNPASLVIGLVGSSISVLTGFTKRLVSVVAEPTAIFNSLNGMQTVTDTTFSLSRYIGGNVDGSKNTALTSINRSLSPPDLIAASTSAMLDATVTARADLDASVTAATNLAALDAASYLDAIHAIVEAFRAAINDPSDQIRLLATLASFQSPPSVPIDSELRPVMEGTASACRQSALASIALAVADYQPVDTQEVTAILALIVPLFDAEIIYVADQNDIDSYNALISLRSAIVTDLQTRGSDLPTLITIKENTNRPSTVIAYKLYQDATRESEIIKRVDPIHPLFMPLSFEVLSS